MRSEQFHELTLDAKLERLYKEGVYIGKIKEGNLIRLLYQLDSFYIQLSYWRYRQIIVDVTIFTSTTILDSYLDQMNISEIIDCSK